MPKIKTRRAAAKRFNITGTGRFKRTRTNKQHILAKKSPKRKRRLRSQTLADKTNERQIRRMLPYA